MRRAYRWATGFAPLWLEAIVMARQALREVQAASKGQ